MFGKALPVLQRKMVHRVHPVQYHALKNANLKSSKLDEHFKNRHGGRDAGNDFETLRVKRAKFNRAGTLPMYGFSPPQQLLLQVFYQVAYDIVESKKPRTADEELIKPCVLKTADIVVGKEAATSAFIQ